MCHLSTTSYCSSGEKMTAYLYSISQHFTGVDKNPYSGQKLMWSMLDSLDQDIKHDHSTARSVTLCSEKVPSDSPGQIHRFSCWASKFHSLLTQWERVQESHPLTKSSTKTRKKWPWSGKKNDMHQSIPPAPRPSRATEEHLHALSVLGTGHSPTPGPFLRF